VSKHLKNVSVVSGLTMVSRVLGLVRESLVARVFGTELMASAFNYGFRLPNLFRRLLAEGALTASFVPQLQEELRDRGRPGAFALVNNVASWLLLVSGTLVVVAMGLFHGDWLIFDENAITKHRLISINNRSSRES
jgi:putative peptidoglycan lipid II flippase